MNRLCTTSEEKNTKFISDKYSLTFLIFNKNILCFTTFLYFVATIQNCSASTIPSCLSDCSPFQDCGDFQYHVLEGCAQDCFDHNTLTPNDIQENREFLQMAWGSYIGGSPCQGTLYEYKTPSCLTDCSKFYECDEFQKEFSSMQDGCAFDCMGSNLAIKVMEDAWKYQTSSSQECSGNFSYVPTDLPSCFSSCNSNLDLIECQDIRYEILDLFGGCMFECDKDVQNEFWNDRCGEKDLKRCGGYRNETLSSDGNSCLANGVYLPILDDTTKIVLNETLLRSVCCQDAVDRVLIDHPSSECDTSLDEVFADSSCNVTKYPDCDMDIWMKAKCAISDDDSWISTFDETSSQFISDQTSVQGFPIFLFECEEGYTFVDDIRMPFFCNDTLIERGQRCNGYNRTICHRSTPCPVNSEGIDVENTGCTCLVGFVGQVVAINIPPYYSGGCVYDDPDPCNVTNMSIPDHGLSVGFCGENVYSIESGDVCVPRCQDGYVPTKDYILCQDTVFLELENFRCVQKCDAPTGISQGSSNPCVEGLKITPSLSVMDSFCTCRHGKRREREACK